MNDTVPRLSIGLPVYNGENYLAAALDALVSQTYDNFELIVSDNASIDGTEAICRDYAARDPRVSYHRQEVNRGAAWNFNHTFELARGEYFKWAAHDDLHAPTFLERCVAALDANPALVLCFTQAAVVDERGRLVEADPDVTGDRTVHGVSLADEALRLRCVASGRPHERYRGVLLYSTRCYEVFGVVRSAAMRRTGLYRSYNGAEKVFLAELALEGRFAEVGESLFFSRWHPGRFSATTSAAAQSLYVNPKASRRIVLPRQLRCTWGYTSLLARPGLPSMERLRCGLVLGRYLLQGAKWRRALADAVWGRGTTVALPQGVRRVDAPFIEKPGTASTARRFLDPEPTEPQTAETNA
jgi:glycosyltransferase involved in cell wall biosynthesis